MLTLFTSNPGVDSSKLVYLILKLNLIVVNHHIQATKLKEIENYSSKVNIY